MAISRVEKSVARVINNTVYGNGFDGNVVIAANTSLSNDMYYENLTINSGCHLNTNGFRVFVKNTLTLNGTIGITSSASVATGTVAGKTPAATSVTGIGGNAFGGTWTVSSIPSRLISYVETALNGAFINTSGTVSQIRGGAGGANGASGTATPAVAAGAGGAGGLNRNALQPGGPGTAGTSGSAVPIATAGVAGTGGGIVLITAQNIVGTGQILSQGTNSTAGGPAATGIAGTAGTTAPNATLTHLVDGSAHYITGDGTHGPHASYPTPNVPHGGHIPHTSQGLHHDRYVYHAVFHNDNCPGGYGDAQSYGHYHGYSPHNASETTSIFTAINGISHVYSHRPHSGVAYSGNTHVQHVDSNPEHSSGQYGVDHVHCSNSKGWFTVLRVGHNRVGYGHTNAHRNAGTSSHAGSTGVAGGAGGAAGRGAGTTAGTDGQSGGGGGIIVITESALPGTVTTSASGGTVNSNTASSGTVLVITNA